MISAFVGTGSSGSLFGEGCDVDTDVDAIGGAAAVALVAVIVEEVAMGEGRTSPAGVLTPFTSFLNNALVNKLPLPLFAPCPSPFLGDENPDPPRNEGISNGLNAPNVKLPLPLTPDVNILLPLPLATGVPPVGGVTGILSPFAPIHPKIGCGTAKPFPLGVPGNETGMSRPKAGGTTGDSIVASITSVGSLPNACVRASGRS